MINLYRKGMSYAEIAALCDISRSAVAGRIYRERVAAGLIIPPYRPRRDRSAGKDRRDQPRLRGRNLAKDPATREVVALINASRLYDTEIADLAGISVTQIRKWRAGKSVGRPIFLQWVKEALARETVS